MELSVKRVTDNAGWLLSLFLGCTFFAVGQWYFLVRGEVLLGFYSLFACVLIFYWLSWRRNFAIPLQNALAITLLLLVYLGVADWASAKYDVQSPVKLFPILAGLAAVLALHLPWRAPFARAAEERLAGQTSFTRRTSQLFTWMLVIGVIMAAVVVLAKTYLAPFDYTNVINFFFVLRSDGVLGDIPSAPFKDWWRLWFPLLHLGLMLYVYRLILYKQEKLGVGKSLLLIYVLGNLGGLAVETLSTFGFGQLPLELKSVHYHFYTVAHEFKTFHDVWHMLSTYATSEIFRWYSFPATHPPLNIVLNWLLIHFTGDNPTLVALGIGAISWTGVFPMFLIGRELYNREFGYYMAGLYAVLPNTLVINMVGLDGLVTTLGAWAIAFTLMGSRRKQHWYMALAGAAMAGFALTHYSMPILLPALFILALMGLRSLEKSFLAWWGTALAKALFFAVGMALPFLLLEMATHWKFDYLAMQNYIVYHVYNNSVGLHPWFVGSWLCWVNYFIFIGVPVTALFVIRWLGIIKGDWKNDVFPWAGIISLMIPFTLGIGRQEGERAWMLFNTFVVGTAALALWKDAKPLRYLLRPAEAGTVEEMGGGWRPMFLLVLALSYINAMLLEMLVVDHF